MTSPVQCLSARMCVQIPVTFLQLLEEHIVELGVRHHLSIMRAAHAPVPYCSSTDFTQWSIHCL